MPPKAFELKIPSADKQAHSIEGRLCGIPKSPAMAYDTNLLSNDISSLKFPNLVLEQDIDFPRRDTRSLDLQFHLMFTTLDLNTSFSDIAEMYRQFWIIDKIFKKMNPLPAQGLQEKSERGATVSILNAHIFLAFLMEALMESCPRHTPWGYAANEPNRE